MCSEKHIIIKIASAVKTIDNYIIKQMHRCSKFSYSVRIKNYTNITKTENYK
jgi:hypothetical protein